MRKEQKIKEKKGKRRVDCGIYKMVDSCCCFITVNPWATSCSNPNMTTDPYGKPFRTVLGYLCEAKRLTAIFKCSRTLSSYLPCGLLPSQIIFVYNHLNKRLLSKQKKKRVAPMHKKIKLVFGSTFWQLKSRSLFSLHSIRINVFVLSRQHTLQYLCSLPALHHQASASSLTMKLRQSCFCTLSCQ